MRHANVSEEERMLASAGGTGASRLFEMDDPAWTEFVDGHPDALAFHDTRWARLLADCYGFQPFVVALTDSAGRITGGLPLAAVRIPFRRSRWVSLPFTDHCPPLVEPNEHAALVDALRHLSDERNVSRVEIRAPLAVGGGVHALTSSTRHWLALESDADEIFKSFKPAVRRNIRSTARHGLVVARGTSVGELARTFYRLQLITRRRRGVPIQPRRFYRLLWERILEPGLGFLMIVKHRDVPIAAGVFLASNGTVIQKYVASDHRYWSLRPNNLLTWAAIQWSSAHGYHTFDLGRTSIRDLELRRFKTGWGTTEEPATYTAVGQTWGDADALHSGVVESILRRSPLWVTRASGELLYKYAA